MTKSNEIKSLNDFMEYNIICTTTEEVKECLLLLNKTDEQVKNIKSIERIVSYNLWDKCYSSYTAADYNNKNINFYLFKKIYNRLNKQEKEKEQQADFEVAEDGRIIKINNKESKKEIFIACDLEYKEKGAEIIDISPFFLDFILKYGLAYATKEARDKAMFKMEIENKSKNIAERLNAGRKIDWKDENQVKYGLHYIRSKKRLCYISVSCYKQQGAIYFLDENFLEVVKQEIGEDNLIKYFEE